MAKTQSRQETPLEAASLNPDDMLQGGLKDDFRGTIIEAVYTRWDYDGNIDEPVLAARLTIQDPDEDEPTVQNWSAGNLDSFVPSKDGRTPCEDDEVGPYALRVGKRAQLNNNTNFAHLMSSIVDAGEAAKGKPFTRANLTASLACIEGLDAHWNRVPQKKRSGLQQDEAAANGGGGQRRGRDVLVVTEVFGYGEATAPATKGAKSDKKAAPAAGKKAGAPARETEPETGDLDDDLRNLVLEAIGENGNEIKKAKLVGAVVKMAGKDPRKAQMIKRVTEADFLESDDAPWTFDEDTATLSL